MAIKSTFDRGGDGMTSGGLDRFLGPPAGDHSSMPESITDGNPRAEPEVPVDCDGADKDQAVCKIAKAEDDLKIGNNLARFCAESTKSVRTAK